MALRIDYTNMMGDVVDGGIAPADWTTASTAFKNAHAGLGRRRDAGELGFLALPGDAALHAQTTGFAAKIAENVRNEKDIGWSNLRLEIDSAPPEETSWSPPLRTVELTAEPLASTTSDPPSNTVVPVAIPPLLTKS